MARAFKRQPLILPSVSAVITSAPGSGGELPTRWDAARQALHTVFGDAALEVFDRLSDCDLPSISGLIASAWDSHGQVWDREDAARYVARLVFGDQISRHPDVPELFRRLSVETGLMAEIEDCRAAGRVWDHETMDQSSEYYSDEIGRFLRGLGRGLEMDWLDDMVHNFFRRWAWEQAERCKIIICWMPSQVGLRPEIAGPPVEFHFYQREGEGDDEALARAQLELRDVFRERRRSGRSRRQGPRKAGRIEEWALWFYRREVENEPIRSIAKAELRNPDDTKAVRDGIKKVRPLLL